MAVRMKIIKRDGSEAEFDRQKIVAAVQKANEAGEERELNQRQIDYISLRVSDYCEEAGRALGVEEIQELVETEIINQNASETAKRYIRYRYQKNLDRQSNTTDAAIIALVECNNEEVKQENSNKNPVVVSVQRDYIAGEVSKDITRRLLLPADITKAHDEGIIHFHDADYFLVHQHNCDLVNLEDMLNNGTVISGTKIDKPHSFSTACNIATQIIAQVASCQYGGQSMTLTHLAPFVDVTRQKILQEVKEEFAEAGIDASDEAVSKIVESRVREDIKRGVQTIQYQVVTLMTTNGQAPFITVFMYLDETDDPQVRADLALVIEEVLRQRIKGVKNEAGVYVTPAFPKLIYVLDEDMATGTDVSRSPAMKSSSNAGPSASIPRSRNMPAQRVRCSSSTVKRPSSMRFQRMMFRLRKKSNILSEYSMPFFRQHSRTFSLAHSLKSRSVSSTSIRTVVISALLNIFKKERNLVTLAQAAVHHADNGNRGLDAEFHIGLAVYVLLKNETGALAVQVKA